MDLGKVSSVVSASVQRAESNSKVTSARPERDAEVDRAGRGEGARRAGPLSMALAQTLNQLGFDVPSGKGAPPATAAQANDAENAAANSGQNLGQALQGFMNSLVQSLGAAGGNKPPASSEPPAQDATSAVAARGRKAYGDLEGRLQSLVQSLDSKPSSAAPAPGTSELESAFQNLSKALQASDSTGSSKMPDLQSFLNTLQQNLQSAGSRLDSAGNLVNTFA